MHRIFGSFSGEFQVKSYLAKFPIKRQVTDISENPFSGVITEWDSIPLLGNNKDASVINEVVVFEMKVHKFVKFQFSSHLNVHMFG